MYSRQETRFQLSVQGGVVRRKKEGTARSDVEGARTGAGGAGRHEAWGTCILGVHLVP